MLHTKTQGLRLSGSGEYFLKGFKYKRARWPSWSCDYDHLNKLSFLNDLGSIGSVVLEKIFENFD